MELFFADVDYTFDDTDINGSSSQSQARTRKNNDRKPSVKELVSEEIWNETIRVITSALMKPTKDLTLKDITRKSVFIQYFVDTNSIPPTCSDVYASSFMKFLAGAFCAA